MRTIFRAVRSVVAPCAFAGLLAACAASQPAMTPTVAGPNGAGFLAGKNGGGLIYAGIRRVVEVYTYPDGKLQESFHVNGSVNGACSDSKGNVFVAAAPEKSGKSQSGYVYEFAHGGNAPIATLNLPKPEAAIACSSDPTTGDLAVTAENIDDYAPSVLIYPKAGGTPTSYQLDELSADPQAAYDSKGDLFATSGSNVGAELLKGKTSFSEIKLSETLGLVGHVQWDGKYWALQSFDVSRRSGDKIFERVYRVQISGAKGRIAGYSQFDDWAERDPGQAWIEGSTILATPHSEIVFWAYPAGGRPVKVIRSRQPVKAITVSTAG
jgi:hypothetical protein